MSDFYRNKHGAFFSYMRRKGVYIAVVLLFAVVGTFAYFKVRGNETGDEVRIIREVEKKPKITLPQRTEETTAANNGNVVVKKAEFKAPIECDISQGFSGSVPVFSETMRDWRLHQGVDYVTNTPENVYAAADGIVEDVYSDGVMGKSVVIEHSDGTRTVYQSLDEDVEVIRGQTVLCGDLIGRTGITAVAESEAGAHLHFAVIRDGAYIDPAEILK